jgi:hypothetical protein
VEDVTLSGPALALVTTVVLGLTGAITYLYFAGRAREKDLTDRAIEREQEVTNRLIAQVDRLIPAVESQRQQIERLVTLIESWRSGKPG